MPFGIPDDVFKEFRCLINDLSPENLAGDGEYSKEQVEANLKRIYDRWEELEVQCGRQVTQTSIQIMMNQEKEALTDAIKLAAKRVRNLRRDGKEHMGGFVLAIDDLCEAVNKFDNAGYV